MSRYLISAWGPAPGENQGPPARHRNGAGTQKRSSCRRPTVERRRFEARSEGQRLRKMLRYELALWSAGIMTVAGVDEAGMSPLAGPVAAGAVVF
jgi:hypothetical protein